MNCPHNCKECKINDECIHGCEDCGYFDGSSCIHLLGHTDSYGGICACDCDVWDDGRYILGDK